MSISIEKGMEFRRDSKTYRITKILSADTYEAENILNKMDWMSLKSSDISHLVQRGDITFIIHNVSGGEVQFHEISDMVETHRKEILRRFEYVKKALEETRYGRSKSRLKKSRDEVAKDLKECIPKKTKKTDKGPKRTAPSIRTLYRWLKAFIASGQDIRSLISNNMVKRERSSALTQECVNIINDKIKNVYLAKPHYSQVTLCGEIAAAVDNYNKALPDFKKSESLKAPHINTVRNYIRKVDGYELAESWYGKEYAKYKYRVKGKRAELKRPLEVVEIDHTVMDMFIIDSITKLPLGRPTLTVAIDVFTRTICGIHIGFDPPSYLSVMYCLKHAISSKNYVSTKYPDIKNQWLNHGVPESIRVDNGKDFISNHLKFACLQTGITIEYCARKKPWHKGKVERFFHTLNTNFLRTKKGSTYKASADRFTLDKMGYNPEKDAILDLDTLIHVTHKWIIDKYHQEFHTGSNNIPHKAWEDATAKYPLRQPPSIYDLQGALGATYERTIQTGGIQFENLYYNCKELVSIRDKYENQNVLIKVDHSDLSCIHVFDKVNNRYLPVPSIWPEYTKNLSLFQHKAVLNKCRERYASVDRKSILETEMSIDRMIAEVWNDLKVTGRKIAARYKNERQNLNPRVNEPESQDGVLNMNEDELENASSSTLPSISKPPVNNEMEDERIGPENATHFEDDSTEGLKDDSVSKIKTFNISFNNLYSL